MNRNIFRLFIIVCVLLPFKVGAQSNIIAAFNAIIKCKEAQITENHKFDKDPETNKKSGQCDIIRFVLPENKFSLVKNVLAAFEKDAVKAYSLNSGVSRSDDPQIVAVGDGTTNSEYISEQNRRYIYALFLAPKSEDETGKYRYAYGMNYEEEDGEIIGKLVITYGTTLKYRQQLAQRNQYPGPIIISSGNDNEVNWSQPVYADNVDKNWFNKLMTYFQSMAAGSTQTRIALASKAYNLISEISEESNVKEKDKNAAREVIKGMLSDKKYSEPILNSLLTQCLVLLR